MGMIFVTHDLGGAAEIAVIVDPFPRARPLLWRSVLRDVAKLPTQCQSTERTARVVTNATPDPPLPRAATGFTLRDPQRQAGRRMAHASAEPAPAAPSFAGSFV